MNNPTLTELSPNQRALIKIRDLKRELQKLKSENARASFGGEIAVVSMACRFPRTANTPEAFFDSLINQTDEVGQVPDDRWDMSAFFDGDAEVPGKMYASKGVFLDDIDKMDPEFFGISPREATWVDPQQRLLLEVGYEAIERAGWTADQISESTGVFVGWMHNDYQNEASDSFLNLNPYIATGAAGSFLCGRLAYYLGLQGPSIAIDTACSSSLVALHLACQSLQRGDCDQALVGGVNAICSPTTNILTCKLKALSPSGHSRAFDAAADGYLRGEGCGVVTLKRLEDAYADQDNILGIIRSTAVGHNGFSSGLTAPNPKAQEKVIRAALARAQVSAEEISYLEAHGTGTELGDPIEMQAAAAALSGQRTNQNRLKVGSVKTNIGHLEAAAGMAGLIKVLLSMQNQKIPGQMNFETPNPHIAWDKIPVDVLTAPMEWPDSEKRIAGVSAFGMSGTNAHIIVEAPRNVRAPVSEKSKTTSQSSPTAFRTPEPTERTPKNPPTLTHVPKHIITISARTPETIQTLADDYLQYLTRHPGTSLRDFAYTTGTGRKHFEHRAALVAGDFDQTIAGLKKVARAATDDTTFQGHHRRTPKIGWQFTGQGSQRAGMGQLLYQTQPVFAAAMDQCENQMLKMGQTSLLEVIFSDQQRLNDTRWTQPAIFALQMGLVKLLQSWGLQPDVVMGHSVGQYAAACTAGVLSWADGLTLISHRGRMIGDLPQEGAMLAVFAKEATVTSAVSGSAIPTVKSLSIAAFNGTHIMLSGPTDAIAAMEAHFASQSVRTKRLTTSHAFHSALMDPVLEPFEKIAGEISFQPPQLPLICNVSGALLAAGTQLNGKYWADHIRTAVRYSQSVNAANDFGCELMLEIGPQSVLTRMATANWQPPASGLISCLHRDRDDDISIKAAVAELYAHGINPDFAAFYNRIPNVENADGIAGTTLDAATTAGTGPTPTPPARKIVLPTYPFQRRRFWGPDKPRAAHAQHHTAHPSLGQSVSLAGMANQSRFESFVEPDSPPWLPDHEVMGQTVMPGAAFVELALAATDLAELHDIKFEQPLRPAGRTAMQTVINTDDQKRRVIETFSCPAESSSWTRHFTASISPAVSEAKQAEPDQSDARQDRPSISLDEIRSQAAKTVSAETFYAGMAELGLNYGPNFQTIQSLQVNETGVLATLATQADIRGYVIPPPLLDGAIHSLAVGLLNEDGDSLFLPVGMKRVRLTAKISDTLICYAKWTQPDGELRTADLTLMDTDGNVVGEIESLQVRQTSRSALRQLSGNGSERLLYQMQWQKFRLPAASVTKRNWLIVGNRPGLAKRLIDAGHEVESVSLIPSQASDSSEDPPPSPAIDWDRQIDTENVPSGILWDFTDDRLTDGRSSLTRLHCESILSLAQTLAANNIGSIECGFQLLTTHATHVGVEDAVARDFQSAEVTGAVDSLAEAVGAVDPHQAKYLGLGRVLGAEQPEFRCRLIDVDQFSETTEAALFDFLVTETKESQFAIRDGQFHVPRLKQVKLPKSSEQSAKFSASPDGAYLITGGLGMLGRQAAKWLAEHGAGQVVLVSRRQPDESTSAFLESIAQTGCTVTVATCDFSNAQSVESLFANFGRSETDHEASGDDLSEPDVSKTVDDNVLSWKPLKGVIHAAGVLDDGLVGDQTWDRFEKVLAPKITGGHLLHQFTQSLPLDFFVLYSSAASVLGSPGQINYATGNAYLDGLAWYRRSLGLPAISINWGPWTEGMAADPMIAKRLALQGITALSVAEAHDAMEKMILSDLAQTTVMDVEWRRMVMGLGNETPSLLEGLAPVRRRSQGGDSEFVAKVKKMQPAPARELMVATIGQLLQTILSTPEIPQTDRPLIELGLDSLMAVEFGTELQMMLGDGFAVAPTMLFDHPTVDAISDHVLELIGETGIEESAAVQTATVETADDKKMVSRDDVAIIGMSCRFPGADNVDQFWQNLIDGVDSVREIPDGRWNVNQFYSADREPGKMYTKEGGFLENIGDFDAEFFNIDAVEACWIDPQHRMLLENSYTALENAGVATSPLVDNNVGVFMGIMGQDYAFLPRLENPEIVAAFQGAGLSHSAGVGRISYVFGFEGPSVAVDTASSSSLVALHQAVRSLQDGNCNLALAGGVNAILAPVNSLLMSKAGLLSPDGRCKSFSASANGFGRGEGCGVVVLKRLSDAVRDGDEVLAVVRGAAVSHNGFSGGITAPSGKAQARVIADALKDARIAPNQVQYLEAHGTGTEYGDPMEISAAAGVYGKGRSRKNPLLVGTVKANISHLEAAGGVSGLIKTVLCLHKGVIPKQLYSDQPSPHVPWKRMPVKMVTDQTPWPDSKERLAAVTALGLVGTNAHVVLSKSVDGCTVSQPAQNAKSEDGEGFENSESTISTCIVESTPGDSNEILDENPNETPASISIEERPQLVLVSARNHNTLQRLVRRYIHRLESDSPAECSALQDMAYTSAVGRRHFNHRVAVGAKTNRDAADALRDWIKNQNCDNGTETASHGLPNGQPKKPSKASKVAWHFGDDQDLGDPKTHVQRVQQLIALEPVFKETILKINQRLATLDDVQDNQSTTAWQRIASFALTAGFANLWGSWGVEPDAAMGFGESHYAAACTAGVMCWFDAAVLVDRRRVLIEQSKDATPDEAEKMLNQFEAFADQFNYYPPNRQFICSVTGQAVPMHRSLGGGYWREHVFADHAIAEAEKSLASLSFDVLVQFKPLDGDEPTQGNLSWDSAADLYNAAGEFYALGGTIDWRSFYNHRDCKKTTLPNYPFEKKRFWITELEDHI
jgi:polyene macrolide polyketide synthase